MKFKIGKKDGTAKGYDTYGIWIGNWALVLSRCWHWNLVMYHFGKEIRSIGYTTFHNGAGIEIKLQPVIIFRMALVGNIGWWLKYRWQLILFKKYHWPQ